MILCTQNDSEDILSQKQIVLRSTTSYISIILITNYKSVAVPSELIYLIPAFYFRRENLATLAQFVTPNN